MKLILFLPNFIFNMIILVETVKKMTAKVSKEVKLQLIPENCICFYSAGIF